MQHLCAGLLGKGWPVCEPVAQGCLLAWVCICAHSVRLCGRSVVLLSQLGLGRQTAKYRRQRGVCAASPPPGPSGPALSAGCLEGISGCVLGSWSEQVWATVCYNKPNCCSVQTGWSQGCPQAFVHPPKLSEAWQQQSVARSTPTWPLPSSVTLGKAIPLLGLLAKETAREAVSKHRGLRSCPESLREGGEVIKATSSGAQGPW